MTEQEAAWWNSEVISSDGCGQGPGGDRERRLTDRIAPLAEQAVLAMYHTCKRAAWTANIIEGFETLMEKQGSTVASSDCPRSASSISAATPG